jgi:hypothetical protein
VVVGKLSVELGRGKRVVERILVRKVGGMR